MSDPLRVPLALLFVILCAIAASQAQSAELPAYAQDSTVALSE
ncbi:hypothetical protein [Rhodopirellula sp. MGV]|nr:hypothetical protein [Rhodopirellula sp. MGV]